MLRRILVSSVVLARVAAGQDVRPAARTGCLERLGPDAFHPITVYLESRAVDSGSAKLRTSANLFVTALAERARPLVGGSASEITRVDSVLHWRNVRTGAGMRIVARRDGKFSWSRRDKEWSDTLQEPNFVLLERALAAARDSLDLFAFPEDAAADTFAFDVSYLVPTANREGKLAVTRPQFATPLFRLAMPWETTVTIERPPRIEYPHENIFRGAIGSLILQYVVDSLGKADVSTLRDIPPPGLKKVSGEVLEAYRDFLAAARRGVGLARFGPARVGGCAVPQLVQQPFEFRIAR
jgi:hypothetical protein